MDKVSVMSCDSSMNEYAIVLAERLNVKLLKGNVEPKDGDIYIVLGGQYQSLNLINLQKKVKVGYIIYNSAVEFRDKYYLTLLKSNPVFNSEQRVTDHLKKEHGVNTLSHFFYDFMKVEPASRPNDIVIISKSKMELSSKLQNKYPDKIINHVLWGDLKSPQELKEKFMNAKYFINVDDGSFNTYAINNALSCGCRVVSHSNTDKETKDFYETFVTITESIEDFDFENDNEDFPPYEELIKQLTKLITPHNHAVLERIIKS